MENKTFSIGQVCKLLNIKSHNLRYLEKVLELDTVRDTMLNRVYTQDDIKELKDVLILKGQGFNYEAIKKLTKIKKQSNNNKSTESNLEIEVNTVSNEIEVLVEEPKNIEAFKNLLKDVIDTSLNESLDPKFNELSVKLDKLKNDNDILKETLFKQQEKHFSDLDVKLTNWRDEHYPSKKGETSFFKKLFK